MQVESKLKAKEIDGRELPTGHSAMVSIRTHPMEPNWVVVDFGGKRFTLVGKEIIKAVQNVLP